jgi:hypothetical protein
LFPKLVEIAISVVEATSTRRLDDGEEVNESEYTDPFCKLSNLQAEEESGIEVNIKRKFCLSNLLITFIFLGRLASAVIENAASIAPESLRCLDTNTQQIISGYNSSS